MPFQRGGWIVGNTGNAKQPRSAPRCPAPPQRTQDRSLALKPSPRRSTWNSSAILLLCLTATLGCFFHTGYIRIMPPAAPETESRSTLSDEDIDTIVEVVAQVARNKGFRRKRSMGVPFGSELLAYYYSPEQVSISVWLTRRSRSIRVRIRDVNNTAVTTFTESIRSDISRGLNAKLPDHIVFY
jgi:hypothetical protein